MIAEDMEDEMKYKIVIDFASDTAYRRYVEEDRNNRNAHSCLLAFHEWLRGQWKWNENDIDQEEIYEKLGEHLEAYDVDLYGEW
jgi:hypothetical protein